jgi:ribonuclease P protein component
MHKQHRLAKREDFNKVFRFGKSVANQQFVLYHLTKPEHEYFRLGVSVSKKIGNAIVRNRLRRIMKEIVRLNKEGITLTADFILIARKPVVEMDYHQIESCMLHVLKKANLYKKRKG